MRPPAHREPVLRKSETRERDHHAAEREQLGSFLQLSWTGEVDHVLRRSTAEVVELGRRQYGRGVEATLDCDKGSCDRGVELSPGITLDLRQGCLVREPCAVGAVRRHRVEAVGDDQEMGREREIVAADAVVARAVHALVMKLDRARLRRHELEPLQQSSGEAGMTAHRSPLGAVQGSLLAQERSVDRHLAEIVQATRPAQSVDLRVGQLQGARQAVDVTSDA